MKYRKQNKTSKKNLMKNSRSKRNGSYGTETTRKKKENVEVLYADLVVSCARSASSPC